MVVGRRKTVVLLVATVTLDRLVVVTGALVVVGLNKENIYNISLLVS